VKISTDYQINYYIKNNVQHNNVAWEDHDTMYSISYIKVQVEADILIRLYEIQDYWKEQPSTDNK
jgi:hypothetical protein